MEYGRMYDKQNYRIVISRMSTIQSILKYVNNNKK